MILLLPCAIALSGCVARTAANIVTLPVRTAGYGYDKMTTSQAEADRNRGREMRKQQARAEKDRRRAEKAERQREARQRDSY
jgi:hypothetical protein